MSTTHTSLDAAASDRKARLAKLASLKRKQPGSDTTVSEANQTIVDEENTSSQTDVYLSGRNYDAVTRGPKLGFEQAPVSRHDTVEQQAERISKDTEEQAAQDEREAEKGIDLFKLQPKKRNWDLKRDLAEKMKTIDVKTQNAIARLVRERIENTKQEAMKKNKGHGSTEDGGEEVGVEGTTLVEAVHLREKEERRNEEEEFSEDGDIP